MNTKATRSTPGGDAFEPLTAEEVIAALHRRGLSVRAWSEAHGYPVGSVQAVIGGRNRARFGTGHLIAVALGMKRGVSQSAPLSRDLPET